MVLAGIESSQKSLIFASGIPDQKRGEKPATLNLGKVAVDFFPRVE